MNETLNINTLGEIMNRVEAYRNFSLANNGYTKVQPGTALARHAEKLVKMGKCAWVAPGYVTADIDKLDIVKGIFYGYMN
jgi:hypothetical protein